MREREVKALLSERLRAEGFRLLDVRYRSRRGIDIEASHPRSPQKLYIEVKGERRGGNPTIMRRRALGEALLQVFEAYGDDEAVYAIALQDTRGFRSLVARIFPALKAFGLHVIFVGNGTFAHLGPNSPTPIPQPVSSLQRALRP